MCRISKAEACRQCREEEVGNLIKEVLLDFIRSDERKEWIRGLCREVGKNDY
jgi:hypothetical protein